MQAGRRKRVKCGKRFLFIPAALALAITACGERGDGYKIVDRDLHGTWERNEQNCYWCGELVLGSDTITITGAFAHLQGFTRNVTLEAGTEWVENVSSGWKGLLYIKDKGAWQSPVPFTYWETGGSPKEKMLTFTGGGDETLKKIAD
jgi:hypothetical protein